MRPLQNIDADSEKIQLAIEQLRSTMTVIIVASICNYSSRGSYPGVGSRSDY